MNANSNSRTTIFISHATPSDNEFATWLASRLSMAGYNVWCDQEKLLGGEDFWDDIDQAIRHDTIKFLLVMSKKAFTEEGKLRRGIQKEVALADTVGIQSRIKNFIVPIRIDDVDYSKFSIDFHRLNGIDCSKNWADGLEKLFKVLERDEVPIDQKASSTSLSNWRSIHQFQSEALTKSEETMQTNWLKLLSMPDCIHFYEILISLKSSEPRAIASNCSLPCSDHSRLLVSFSHLSDLQEALGAKVPIKQRATIKTSDFLQGHMRDLPSIPTKDAKRKLSSLFRQGLENYLRTRQLSEYEMAGGQVAWWFAPDLIDSDTLRFSDFNAKSRRRSVVGRSGKKKDKDNPDVLVTRYYWHLGFTLNPVVSENSVLSIKPRIIISDDRKTPLKNKTRLNAARRRITKMWFNDKWRGLILGISNWLSEHDEKIVIPLGSGETVEFSAIPETLISPISIASDPVLDVITDEQMAAEDEAEYLSRLSDPAYRFDGDEEDAEDEYA